MENTRLHQVKKFNKIYNPKTSKNPNKHFRINLLINKIKQGHSVLDIGCGSGFAMKNLRDRGCACEGIEISKLEANYSKNLGFRVYEYDLETNWAYKINKKYDYVMAGEIIEHIFDTDLFLKNIYKVLKKNGCLIISTPNVATLGRRIMLFLGKNPYLETTLRKTDAGHIRYFTFKDLENLLIYHGFIIKKTESTYISFDKQGRFKSRLLAKLFPTFGSNIVIEAVKN
ncbi:hypothetical protein A2V49_02305 [candidate division WWE3 bacterium RBG_19FT_COMBO_34_6]|uniref:Methyltransferase type 11 domain-containing protein n=1 Tax=candidate division WWE3 bacterium RBG_19FT_COMBO_34_6 TaxID=1802612 RepID=A0A1F4ULM6_UNCKA|nr:MAG: hypothetical protein A2V49_02305 [candidate division WWE3 bacterium RBG_19FT_COMBO_34_6]